MDPEVQAEMERVLAAVRRAYIIGGHQLCGTEETWGNCTLNFMVQEALKPAPAPEPEPYDPEPAVEAFLKVLVRENGPDGWTENAAKTGSALFSEDGEASSFIDGGYGGRETRAAGYAEFEDIEEIGGD